MVSARTMAQETIFSTQRWIRGKVEWPVLEGYYQKIQVNISPGGNVTKNNQQGTKAILSFFHKTFQDSAIEHIITREVLLGQVLFWMAGAQSDQNRWNPCSPGAHLLEGKRHAVNKWANKYVICHVVIRAKKENKARQGERYWWEEGLLGVVWNIFSLCSQFLSQSS